VRPEPPCGTYRPVGQSYGGQGLGSFPPAYPGHHDAGDRVATALMLFPGTAPLVGEAALVRLEPTPGHDANGVLTLAETSMGVDVIGEIAGLPPNSEPGFHVHEHGDCRVAEAESAGKPFNPDEEPHGDPRGDSRHLGDMLNLETDGRGVARVAHETVGATLTPDGPSSLRLRSIIVHADPDD
jgi:superoxide dismutase, Cu-Zn family